MKWTTKWLSFICSQSCVYVINATVTVAGSHGVAPSRPKRRKPTNDKLMTQQTIMQKIRFENGLAVAKSKIEYVMCRIEEIRLQLQGQQTVLLTWRMGIPAVRMRPIFGFSVFVSRSYLPGSFVFDSTIQWFAAGVRRVISSREQRLERCWTTSITVCAW